MLVQYAQGIAQSGVQPIADFLAPTVPVPTMRGRYKKYSQKNRFRIPNTKRAMGGKAVVLEWTMEDATYDCTPNSIDVPVDMIEQREAESAGANFVMESAQMAAEVAQLSHEQRVIQLAKDNVTATANVGGWLDANTLPTLGDPVGEIDSLIESVTKAAPGGSGSAVGILFGSTAWRYFKNHSAVRQKFVVGRAAGQVGLGIPTLDMASGLFLHDPEIMVSRMVYDTGHEGQTRSLDFLLTTDVFVFVRRSAPTRLDPTFMKTFRLANQWMVPGTYVREDQRAEVVKFDWSADVEITNSDAGARLTVGNG
jgi:hypothetical protein